MAPLLIRSKGGATFSQSNRGRDIGILVACVAAIALLLWLISRLCGYHVFHGSSRRQETQQPQQQYMDPARFMLLCTQRDEQKKQKQKGLLTTLEIDIMAPLTSHRPLPPPLPPVVVAPTDRGGPAGSTWTNSSDLKKPKTVVMEPESIIRARRASGEGAAVCSVCLEGFDEEDLVRATRCSHFFHGPCLERWLMRYQSRCPLCQANLKPDAKAKQSK